ncbi:MAG: MBL fold metallo-hydrolase, partial [Gammaproteobacteria bacterium]|nr:MBL fold metallo-hydrolase [Gammaproteobacteria bacterium]
MQKLIVGVTGLFLALLIVLSVLLWPAHKQVRAAAVEVPGVSVFDSLKTPEGPVRIYYVNTSDQKLPDSVLTHSVFIFEWADGRQFMLDAGMTEARAIEFGENIELALGGDRAQPHGNIASVLGRDIERVSGVGFTHLHIDHTEGVGIFCENTSSEPMLLQTSRQATAHNFNTTEGASIVNSSCLKGQVVDRPGIVTSDVFPGLGFMGIGGHTPGSTLFAAWLGDQLYVFSGDITNSKAEIIE